MIAIVTAMKEEANALKGLAKVRRYKRNQRPRVALSVTGVGKERALAATTYLLEKNPRPDLVLSVGFAGALRGGLDVGDLVLSRRVHLLNSTDCLDPHPRYFMLAEEALLETGLPYVRGDSMTVPKPVLTIEEKGRLAKASEGWVVDMEDYWIGTKAAEYNVPFLSVRSVLDTALDRLPAFVGELAQDDRRRVWRAFSGALTHPWRIPTLNDLRQRHKIAQRRLATFAATFLVKVTAAEAYATH